jgi:hypothetical protein
MRSGLGQGAVRKIQTPQVFKGKLKTKRTSQLKGAKVPPLTMNKAFTAAVSGNILDQDFFI